MALKNRPDAATIGRVGKTLFVLPTRPAAQCSADAFLSQRLKSAELVRLAGDADIVTGMLRDGKIDLYATGTDSVQRIADRLPGSKIIGAFDTVAFAISTAKGGSPDAKSRLTQLVNEAKAAGIVQKAINLSGRQGVRAAPN